jgi:hypothetical protein
MVAFGVLLSVGWGACNIPRPTPYTGGPGFPGQQGSSQPSPDQADAGAESADAGAQHPLVGQWQTTDQTLDIRPDGTVLINGSSFTYAIGGQTLFVQGPDGSAASYPFELSGNQLVVTVNNQRVTYTRKVVGIGPPGPAAAGAQSLPQELFGKWCYIANVNANDGGRQSSTCFALNPDGSYQYHAESSSSGQAYGNSWGTASQTDDAGRWQSTGNTLTATSNSGKVSTYTFEKRNHPKTNDPMLVIDGQAFVTYYQKPPW